MAHRPAPPADAPRNQRQDRALSRAHYDRRLEAGGLFGGLAGGLVVTGDDGKFWITGLVPDTPIGLQATLGVRASDVVTVKVGPGSTWSGVTQRLS